MALKRKNIMLIVSHEGRCHHDEDCLQKLELENLRRPNEFQTISIDFKKGHEFIYFKFQLAGEGCHHAEEREQYDVLQAGRARPQPKKPDHIKVHIDFGQNNYNMKVKNALGIIC